MLVECHNYEKLVEPPLVFITYTPLMRPAEKCKKIRA